jgi:nucleoside-diphosphate kinase
MPGAYHRTQGPTRNQDMAVEQTLSIIKPDGVQKNLIGEIYSRFEKAGLEIVAARMMHLTQEQAQGFYAVHKERPFFNDLVSYMTSGPVVVQALQGEDAIAKNREIMGATNPADAAPGTIRADFAASIEENVVHGSDGPDTAATEIAFFFGDDGVCPRTR